MLKSDASMLLKSAYEIAREANIRKNNDVLKALGIGLNDEDVVGEGSRHNVFAEEKRRRRRRERKETETKESDRKKRRVTVKVVRRRSRRIANLPTEFESVSTVAESSSVAERRTKANTPDQLEKYRRLMAKHAEAGIKLPPNATYKHTVHRVTSMSEKALDRRIRVIENAQGKYAVLKMRMFAEVLILEGYDELAKKAEAALGRLLELPKYKDTADDQAALYSRTVKRG